MNHTDLSQKELLIENITNDSISLALVGELFQALNENGIRYCHWKSNASLDRSMQGLGDLDLLVDRTHNRRFKELLYKLDFKPALSPPFRQYPAMEDYLGFDRDSGRLIHLHVHYQLILGEQFVKNYRLPLEQIFLETDHTYAGVKIPPPELEIIILSMRALLKYRDGDFIKSLLPNRSLRLPAHIRKEFSFLLEQTTIERIKTVLETLVDFVSADLILETIRMVTMRSNSGYRFYRLRNQLRSELAPYQRYSRRSATVRYFRSSFAARRSFFSKQPSIQKKIIIPGGMTIAFIGADGAGKSTILKEVYKWLSWRLTVYTYYMGSKQPSRRTRLVLWCFRLSSYPYRASRAFLGEENLVSKVFRAPQRLLQYLYLINVGKDRYSRFISGKRYASQGALVLYDRYPLDAVRIDGRSMDGSRIASLKPEGNGRITTSMAGREQNIYENIDPPDHLFVLRVNPDVSSQRKPDHKPEVLKTKIQSIDQIERDGLCIKEIDTNQPLDRTLLQIKTALWDLL